MGNVGFWEIAIVVVVALLVFGPKKLPELGSSIGRAISGFKQGLRETKEEMQTPAPAEAATVTSEAPTGGVTSAPAAEAARTAATGVDTDQTNKS